MYLEVLTAETVGYEWAGAAPALRCAGQTLPGRFVGVEIWGALFDTLLVLLIILAGLANVLVRPVPGALLTHVVTGTADRFPGQCLQLGLGLWDHPLVKVAVRAGLVVFQALDDLQI